jgi:hypothetical protein
VLKKSVIVYFSPVMMIAVAEFLFSSQLRGGFHSGYFVLTEEAHQSLDVLRSRCQEELLAHELQSPQTQAPQSDLILQFCKQGLYFLSLPLCFGELWCVDQLPRTLSGRFVLVDDKTPEGSTGALWPERARATLFACPDVVEGTIAINSATIVEELAGTKHNIVYVATENNSVYAFDADTGNQLGVISLNNGTDIQATEIAIPYTDLPLDAMSNPCNTVVPEVGITGTPVIDV